MRLMTRWIVQISKLGLALMVAGAALAQETTGTLAGVIQDPTDAAVRHAKVTATEAGTQRARATLTDDSGVYTLPLLPVGTYTLSVEAVGFKRAVQAEVDLHLAENLRVNFKLQLGAVTETVEVTEEFTRVNTEDGSLSALLGTHDMQTIPVNGRNFNELLALLPGTVSSIPTEPQPLAFNRAGASINGTQPGHNNWSADGIFNMDTGGNGNMNDAVPIESVAEFRLLRSDYSAEYGVAGGAQVDIITKSGTNQFHGHFEEYFRNDKLDTRNFFSPVVPPLRFNSPGFTVGGPVIIPKVYNRQRKKTYFFGSEEWQRYSRGSTATASLPTLAERVGNYSGLKTIKDPATNAPFVGNIIPATRIGANAAAYASLYPAPTSAGTGLNYESNPWVTSNLRQDLLRVDHQLSDKHQLAFRGSHDYYEYINPSSALGYATFRHSTLYTFGATLTSTFSPTLQNQFVAGKTSGTLPTGPTQTYNPQQLGIDIPLLFTNNPGAYPTGVLDVSGLRYHPPSISATGYTGITFPDDQNSPTNVWQIKDNLSKVVRNHLLKAGYLFHREWKAQPASYNLQGSFAFNGSYTGDGFADLLLGNAYSFSQISQIVMPNVVRYTHEAYVDDHWKISSHFSVDVGVRFTHFGLPNDQQNQYSTLIPSLYSASQAPVVLPNDTLQPGTGNPLNGLASPSAYEKNHQWGFAPRLSLSWDPFGKGSTVIHAGYGQFYNREAFDAIGFRQLASNPPNAQSVTLYNTSLDNPGGGTLLAHPQTLSGANLDVQPQYYQTWNIGLQRSVFKGAVWDVSYVGNRGTHLARIQDQNQPQPSLLVAQGKVNVDTVRPYQGYGAISYADLAGNSFYNGLQTSLSQTYHNGVTLQVSYTYSKVLSNADTSVDTYNRNLEYAPASFDLRHNFWATGSWQLPFFKSNTGLAHKTLGGWQASAIYALQSGLPTDITLGRDIAGVGNTSQRPQITCDPNGGPHTVSQWFDTSCFAAPPLGTFATTSARSVRLPGVDNVTFSLLKRIPLTESKQLEFQGDIFNLLNHTQFSAVGTTYYSSTFGQVTAANSSREVQLGVKLRW